MTAIARATINNIPFLFGDLLISGPEVTEPTLALPTIDNIGRIFPAGSGYVPTGIRQKLTIVDDDLVIGWAGPAFAARTLLNEIRSANAKSKIGHEELRGLLESTDDLVWRQGLSLTGFLWEDGTNFRFNVGGETASRKGTDEIVVLGSGGRTLGVLAANADQEAKAITETDEVATLGKAISIAGNLFTDEIFRSTSLLHYFGGGYEIVTRFDRSFQKLNDITYIFFNAWTDGDKVSFDFPKVAIKLKYIGDVLLMRSDKWIRRGKTREMETKTTIFVVDPVYRTSIRDEWDAHLRPSLNSHTLCQQVTFHDRHGQPGILSSLLVGKSISERVKIEEHDANVTLFAWSDPFLHEMSDKIRDSY